MLEVWPVKIVAPGRSAEGATPRTPRRSKCFSVAFASIIGTPPAQRQFGSAVLQQRHKVFSNIRAIQRATPRELQSIHWSGAAQSRALRHAENCVPGAAMSFYPRAIRLPPHRAYRPLWDASVQRSARESDACARYGVGLPPASCCRSLPEPSNPCGPDGDWRCPLRARICAASSCACDGWDRAQWPAGFARSSLRECPAPARYTFSQWLAGEKLRPAWRAPRRSWRQGSPPRFPCPADVRFPAATDRRTAKALARAQEAR